MATGLVVKSSITDATPGGFSAHVKTRADQDRMALQQLGLHADVMFGGGKDHYLPTNGGGTRKDGRDLLAEARDSGYQVVTSADGLAGDLRLPVIGLFAKGAMHYAIDRSTTQEPSLPEMTRKALELLAQRQEGFFLMIEGSEIDHTAHVNDGGALVPEVLEYDATVAAVMEFAKRDGRTLVVSTSDHETGGLTITGGDWTTARNGPRHLRANKASADAMVTMIKNGAALTDVLRDYASVTNVTEEEKAAYEAATQGNPSDLQKRRTLALTKIINARAGIKWSVPDHSAVDVNVYAYGPGQELFRGAKPATWMATGVAQVLGLDLEEATREARARIKGDVGKTAATAAADD
jgi:alkaline phosphatase